MDELETPADPSGAGRGDERLLEGLARRVADGTATVGVIGMGYVGLPLAMAFAEAGLEVVGVDVDEEKVRNLEEGVSYIGAVDDERLRRARTAGRFRATAEGDSLVDSDAILICVPTPLGDDREPDLSFVEATARSIAKRLRPGQLVVLESTTYPGTTSEVVRPLLEESGLRCGRDFLLAFSPEREDPGNPRFQTTDIPKVVGGLDPLATEVATALYEHVVPQVVTVSSAEVAEACKLTENVFRAVNIALVNELKVIYDRLGIDVREVLDAAETKPFGFMRFDPGPGWGGHCIPVDPYYLSWKAAREGVAARFIELAGEVNIEMPRWVVGKLESALEGRGRALDRARVLVLGLAYKRDVADPRESPAFEVLDLLRRAGAEIAYHDPFFPRAPSMRSWPDLPELTSVPLEAEELATYDAAVVVTDHGDVDYGTVLECVPLIVDSRGIFARRFGADRIAGRVVEA